MHIYCSGRLNRNERTFKKLTKVSPARLKLWAILFYIMLVTINTDASFHPKLKYGAYAFWAICNDWKITKSGINDKRSYVNEWCDTEAKKQLRKITSYGGK